jgi:hypothetical protein
VHGGLLGVVEGHLREDVVAHVRVGDVVQRAVHEEAEVPVHGAHRAAQPGPLLLAEVRHEHVRVLQVGDQHEVVVHDQVGHPVVEEYSTSACAATGAPCVRQTAYVETRNDERDVPKV